LLFGSIDIPAVVIEMPEPLLEARLRISPQEGVEEIRAKVVIAIEELEKLDVAIGQFNALAGTDAAHAGTAFRGLHGPLNTFR
jgi:hypothetical protein